MNKDLTQKINYIYLIRLYNHFIKQKTARETNMINSKIYSYL